MDGFVVAILIVAVFVVASRFTQPGRRDPDERASNDLFLLHDAAVLRLIRERFKCDRDAARALFDRYEKYHLEAYPSPIRLSEDGRLLLDDMSVLDQFAAAVGLPADGSAAPPPAWDGDWPRSPPSQNRPDREALVAHVVRTRNELLDGALVAIIKERYDGAESATLALKGARSVREAVLHENLSLDGDGRLVLTSAMLGDLDRWAAETHLTLRSRL
jgi:hypothetical protein